MSYADDYFKQFPKHKALIDGMSKETWEKAERLIAAARESRRRLEANVDSKYLDATAYSNNFDSAFRPWLRETPLTEEERRQIQAYLYFRGATCWPVLAKDV